MRGPLLFCIFLLAEWRDSVNLPCSFDESVRHTFTKISVLDKGHEDQSGILAHGGTEHLKRSRRQTPRDVFQHFYQLSAPELFCQPRL